MDRGILGPWEPWRKLALFALIGVALAVFFISSMPLGMVAIALLFGLAHIWRDLAVENPLLGSYYPGTTGYKAACFFMCAKPSLPSLASDVNVLGFGPAREDSDHNMLPGLTPITRMSSWFAALGAVALSSVDFLLSSAHLVRIPWWITVPASAIGWFVTIQLVLAVRALQGKPDSIMAMEPKPQVMLSSISKSSDGGIDIKPVLAKWAGIAGVLVFVTFVLNLAIHMPWWALILAFVAEVLVAGLISMSRDLQAQYVAGWEEREARREEWQGYFSFMKPEQLPTLLGEHDLPTLEEWESSHSPDDPYSPTVKLAVMSIPRNCTFSDFVGKEDYLRGAIPNCKMVAIAPVGVFDEYNRERIGTVGPQAFRVWYSDSLEPNLLDPNIDSRLRELAARSTVVSALARIKGIGECVYYQALPVTKPESQVRIVSVQVVPRESSVNLTSFLSRIEDIQVAVAPRGGWVRVMDSASRDAPPGTITMYIADSIPVAGNIDFIQPASVEQRRIDNMVWNYVFHTTGVRGANGLPEYVRRGRATEIVDKIEFVLPDGFTVEDLQSRASKIAATSGNTFLEINPIPLEENKFEQKPGQKLTRRQQQELARKRRPSFNVVASRIDPLDRFFTFNAYRERILHPRERGKDRLDWVVGVTADDELAYDDWESASGCHLLVAGQSGSGKSVAMTDMILQLIHNNGPSDLRLWMIEPKNEMQVYRDVDIVDRFVDSWTPNDRFISNAADLMEELVAEMQERNRRMTMHPKNPKKLSKAREIAMREANEKGIPWEDHPLFMPYIIMIMEECATLFAEATDKEEKAEQARLLRATTEIARKARSAGIYLVAATQYPTNASIPSVIRQQMRRIGMKCRDALSSTVVIGETGLEKIGLRGVGMMETKGTNQYRLFRSLYAEDGDPDAGARNDIFDTLRNVPTKTGGLTPNQISGHVPSGRPIVTIPSESIFDRFAAGSIAARLDDAINSGRPTKDVTDSDVPY